MALHEQSVGASDEWYTPPHVFGALGCGFDTDAASPGRAMTPWIVKKLERERLGLRGSRATRQDLVDEIADVVIVADLICAVLDIDLGSVIIEKFNKTSRKYNLKTELMGPEIGCGVVSIRRDARATEDAAS
jgi:hypothetical protein